jgi:hypothetical protein
VSDKQDSWENVIRTACKKYPGSFYSLCKAAEVDQGQMSRFMAGEQSIGLATAEKLGRVLGIELVVKRQRKKP